MFVDRKDTSATTSKAVIAIVGGGYSGAAVALHLARNDCDAQVVVFEPRTEIGRGLAYSTPDPDHRLNVPDHRMTLISEDPNHFKNWLGSAEAPILPGGSATLAGEIFAPRAVFGQYVAACLADLVTAGRIIHRKETVIRIDTEARGYFEGVADGDIDADDEVCISLQKYVDDGAVWWSVEISDEFASGMTDFNSGNLALADIEEIRDGKARGVAANYAQMWDDDWTIAA